MKINRQILVLINCSVFFFLGKRIVFAGDSAGANLIAGCTLKILSAGLRPPDGLFMAYAPLLVSFIPSPARLLCLMDPLLPFGFMMRCLKGKNNGYIKNNNTMKHKRCLWPMVGTTGDTSSLLVMMMMMKRKIDLVNLVKV